MNSALTCLQYVSPSHILILKHLANIAMMQSRAIQQVLYSCVFSTALIYSYVTNLRFSLIQSSVGYKVEVFFWEEMVIQQVLCSSAGEVYLIEESC